MTVKLTDAEQEARQNLTEAITQLLHAAPEFQGGVLLEWVLIPAVMRFDDDGERTTFTPLYAGPEGVPPYHAKGLLYEGLDQVDGYEEDDDA